MRTKTAILSAVALAAGIASSMAQANVYSVNIVGYVNVNLPTGFTMMANQMDLDGTGTNNTVQTVFGTNLPPNSTIYAFSGGAFQPSAGYTTKGGWSGGTNAVNAALNPGGGVFVKVPSAKTITLVGNVLTGGLTNSYINGYNIVASKIPQGGLLQTDLGYTPTANDVVYQFNPLTQQYLTSKSYTTKGGWQASQPTLAVGESFWLKSAAVGGGVWTRTFTNQ